MYSVNKCKCPGCTKSAVSTISEDGKILEGMGYCLEHHPNPDEARARIREYVMTHEKIVGLDASGIEISNIDFKNKKFYGCNFQHCNFTNIHTENMRQRMCMFDFSTFSDCDFINSNIQFSSVSGSKFVHVILTGSDLIHNNFNGITAYQCSFDNSDLYNSRFIKSILINTSFKDCNLKKTVFYESMQDAVSFKLSNTKEALFDRTKGGMIGDSDAKFEESTENQNVKEEEK